MGHGNKDSSIFSANGQVNDNQSAGKRLDCLIVTIQAYLVWVMNSLNINHVAPGISRVIERKF